MLYAYTEVPTRWDPRLMRGFIGRALFPRRHYARDLRIVLSHATGRSMMTLACATDHVFETACSHVSETHCSEDAGKVVFLIDAKPGTAMRLVKYMTYHSSRRSPAEELCERAERSLDRAVSHGFTALLAGQRQHVAAFWRRSDVQIASHPVSVQTSAPTGVQIQQAIRFSLFHILQASARAEGAGIPAKGLTGLGYEGHYFWDTEIYLIPFLTYTAPRVARNLLQFRFGFLAKARERARTLHHKGALFPWRTINGEEASAYYAAGTAQYHINADIVYALRKYVNATGDRAFLDEKGAEVLVETARLWRDLGFFSERQDGRFCIPGVTGPDEYTTVVNNNLFTNLMARENLRYAAETLERLRDEKPERFAALVDETGLQAAEMAHWRDTADKMYLPFDTKQGVHLQDDEFLDKKPWDFEGTSLDKYPLLFHYHPLVIYRHRVIKQADVVLAMFLLGDQFSAEEKKRNFDFYDPLTSGDSSLSACIQSIEANEVGYVDQAVEYARYALLMDLADLGRNVKDGLHIASMGGTWMVSVYGFAGFRDYEGRFSFRPRPSEGLDRLRFPLTLRGQILDVVRDWSSGTRTRRSGSRPGFPSLCPSSFLQATRTEPGLLIPSHGGAS
jgi:alpha,alpha-trehalose phosphorylase